MKLLLIVPQFNSFPVGIAYIASSLKRAGHEVDGYVFGKDKIYDLRVALTNKEYDFVATGGLSSQFATLKKITDIVKSLNKKVIMGGGIITSEPELMSRAFNINYAVLGEGEETIVDLLSSVESGSDISQVEGIGYFDGSKFNMTARRKQIEQLDSLPLPDFDSFQYNKFLDIQKPTDQYYYDIFDNPREYPLVTSRSCPFLCTFCYHPAGDKYRQRSLDSVFLELETVIPKYRINIVAMYDELFSYDEQRVLEFCRRFNELRHRFPWEIRWGGQMRVAGLKDSMLDAMKESGCYAVSYGFESYSPVILKSMRKNITPQQIHTAIHATLDRQISLQGNFIFGDPAETIETARETLEFWKEHREAGVLLTFILACPNSALYKDSIQRGIIKDRLDFIKNHLFDCLNMTSMTDAQYYRLITLMYKHAYKYHFFTIPLSRKPNSITVKCPHCNKVIEYKNYAVPRFIYHAMMYCRHCRKRFFSTSLLYFVYLKLIAHVLPLSTYRVFILMNKIKSKFFLLIGRG